MSITVELDSEETHEQINDSVQYIFEGIKSILEKDEFGFFELKSKRKIDDEIERTDEQIQKLIAANRDRDDKNSQLLKLVEQLKVSNKSKAATLINRIGTDAN